MIDLLAQHFNTNGRTLEALHLEWLRGQATTYKELSHLDHRLAYLRKILNGEQLEACQFLDALAQLVHEEPFKIPAIRVLKKQVTRAQDLLAGKSIVHQNTIRSLGLRRRD
jgi:hypothetical protein